uniref:Hes family bHLH transcription factor 2 n=1 Tax=Equus caballus TaxID=9796 RepID=A0A9L0RUY0_HORSE
ARRGLAPPAPLLPAESGQRWLRWRPHTPLQVLGGAAGPRPRSTGDAKVWSGIPGALPSPLLPPPCGGTKAGVGPRRRPDSAGRDPLGGRRRLLKGGLRGWRALLWLLLGQSTEPASRLRSLLRLRAGAGLPLAEAPRGAAFPPSMGLPRRTGDRAELRKSLKPLLEKRRRARINESLRQLKGLILPLLGRESSCYSKLEKADILEMTVRFLQELPASSCPAAAPGNLPDALPQKHFLVTPWPPPAPRTFCYSMFSLESRSKLMPHQPLPRMDS